MACILDFENLRLSSSVEIGEFTCGNQDLDEFLLSDACTASDELLAVTYLFKSKVANQTVAFFSVLNDKIAYESFPTKSSARKFFRCKLPHRKRGYDSYPSVKLGRLGVHELYARSGLGTEILDLIKMSFVTNNKTGCRFITVDAYNEPKTISFYEKNGFKFFPADKKDEGQKTRLMYFDLRPFRDSLNSSDEGE